MRAVALGSRRVWARRRRGGLWRYAALCVWPPGCRHCACALRASGCQRCTLTHPLRYLPAAAKPVGGAPNPYAQMSELPYPAASYVGGDAGMPGTKIPLVGMPAGPMAAPLQPGVAGALLAGQTAV